MDAQRYYCHQCSVEFPQVASDFTCPTCNSGFIEELGPVQRLEHGLAQDGLGAGEGGNLAPLMEAIMPGLIGGPGRGDGGRGRGRTRIQISRGNNPPLQNLGMDQAALENAIQDFVVNLAGMGFAGGGQMGAMQAMQMGGHAPGGNAQIHFVGPGFQIHGNPRDYAWGRGGLDTIITMLLNQVDGAGPPPMDSQNIQEIPTVKISDAQVAANSSCSVCWEDFTVDEEVKQLECDHFFHGPCIVPWLELHGTCPVCRKVLNPAAAARESTDQGADSSPHEAPPDLPSNPPPPSNPAPPLNAPGPPTPQRAPGGAETGAPGGGLTGLIVSALNQVFNYNSRSSQSPGAGGSGVAPSSLGSVPLIPPTTSVSQPENPQSSVSSMEVNNGGNAARPAHAQTGATRDNDEETPATRRQRLDPDFVDFDLE